MHEVEQAPYRLMIREMQPDERPRERLRSGGPAALSNSELLAILLNTGIKGESVTTMAQRLLHDCGGLTGLMRMEFVELAGVRGVGESKASKVKAAFELGRRLAAISDQGKPRIESPEDVVQLLGIEMAALEQEQLRVVLLDTKNHIQTSRMVYQGSVNAASVRAAVRHNSVGIVLVHNHPSGDPTPSAADVNVTLDLVKAGDLLDIKLVDHLIIGQGRHVSLKRLGLGFPK
ncbi:MAG TPA: DNA repair protein RadC [Thermomicrobiales bacterium]|nr:DNA repair protein RadC [Thermomicrobiales bacterium]